MSAGTDTFGARSTLEVGGRSFEIFRLEALQERYDVARLPYTLRILLENLLRNEDGETVTPETVEAVARWSATADPSDEITFSPSRVLLQDFTGVPAIVDLAAMRDAVRDLGGDPARIDPLVPAELVIDHSVQVDEYGTRLAMRRNAELEFQRNRERYAFLRWGQQAFDTLKVVPPNTGICHQVNIEYLARVVEERDGRAFPDTLLGTDSHTTMVNGLGVLGWGVGGIEAEAAMLGEPVSMLVPQVVGFKLTGRLPEGSTATDLVLTVTQILRNLGVVGKFVEYFGPGLAGLALADRATIGNMSPEYGATCGFFPVDEITLDYLGLTGRTPERIALVEAYCRENMLWHEPDEHPTYSQVVELDLGDVEPSLAGPRRPQDRVPLAEAKQSFFAALDTFGASYGNGTHDRAVADTFPASDPTAEQQPGPHEIEEPAPIAGRSRPRRPSAGVEVTLDGETFELAHGAVVIAAITSCTNTSNPQVMLGAGLLAKKAVERGLARKPWVKSSLAPGSKVVTEYYERAGLTPYLEQLGFHTVGYGCTTCIGNSGPAARADLEGDRGRRSRRLLGALREPQLRGAHPPRGEGELPRLAAARGRLCARRADGPRPADGADRPGRRPAPTSSCATSGRPRRRSRRRSPGRSRERCSSAPMPTSTRATTSGASSTSPRAISTPGTRTSTYVRRPPYFEGMSREPAAVDPVRGARCLVWLGDSVTTDHISPAGSIRPDSPAGRYLTEHGIERRDFNSYGSRRGNHEVMVRGTFANVRLRNMLVPGSEGTWTVHVPSGEEMTIFEASERYLADGTPTVVLAGKEYGSGSSRDWAAKGPNLLGVRAVLAESYERIHRTNLLMMGVLPLEFPAGQSAESLGLTGRERFDVEAPAGHGGSVRVTATSPEGEPVSFDARVRIDTAREYEYFRSGGILLHAVRLALTAV